MRNRSLPSKRHSFLRACIIAVYGSLLFPISLWPSAAPVVVVISSNLKPYQESFAGFRETFGGPVSSFILSKGQPTISPGSRVVVAFGAKAALFPYPPNLTVIYGLAPGTNVEDPGETTIKIYSYPSAFSVLYKLKEIQPSLKRVGVVWMSDTLQDYLHDKDKITSSLGIVVLAGQLHSPDDLPNQLRVLKGKVDALWIPPDPLLVTPANFATLKEFSVGNLVPFYAPAETLIEEGAVASIYASYHEMGRQMGQVAERALQGHSVRRVYYPEKLRIAVNLSAAKTLGITLSPEILKEAEKVLP